MNHSSHILGVTDAPDHIFWKDLATLYPSRLKLWDLRRENIVPRASRMVVFLSRAENVLRVPFRSLEKHASEGSIVIFGLYEFAQRHGRRFYLRDNGKNRPRLRIIEEDALTRGFRKGNLIYWYRNVGNAEYARTTQFQYREIELPQKSNFQVLAVSEKTRGAVFCKEKLGAGVFYALDLMSPMDLTLPGDPRWDSMGSFNKYIFLGNLLGTTVRHGKYLPKILSYPAFVQKLKSFQRNGYRLLNEGRASGGHDVYSLNLGDPKKPMLFFESCIHGAEWETAYGLLAFARALLEEKIDLSKYFLKILPIVCPYGYIHLGRHNAHGININRNFDCHGKTYCGSPDEIDAPWTFGASGPHPYSEPETKILKKILIRHRVHLVFDVHGTQEMSVLQEVNSHPRFLRKARDNFHRRMRNRYLLRQLGGNEVRQIRLDPWNYDNRRPVFTNLAAQHSKHVFVAETPAQYHDTYATVMQTDFTAELCLSVLKSVMY